MMTPSRNRVPAAAATAATAATAVVVGRRNNRGYARRTRNVATPRSVARLTEFRIMAALPPSVGRGAARSDLAYSPGRSGHDVHRRLRSPRRATTTTVFLGSVSVQESVDHRATYGTANSSRAWQHRGGDTVTMCQTEIARRRKQTPPRARTPETPSHRAQGTSVKAAVEVLLLATSTPSRYSTPAGVHFFFLFFSLRHATHDSSFGVAYGERSGNVARPHLRVSIRATARERVATDPARISWFTVAIVRDASQSVPSLLSSLVLSLFRSSSLALTHDETPPPRTAETR